MFSILNSIGSFSNNQYIYNSYWSRYGVNPILPAGGVLDYELDTSRNILYMCGKFANNNLIGNRIAGWNFGNSTFNNLNSGVAGYTNSISLDISKNILYVGGQFITINGTTYGTAIPILRLAIYNVNTSTWTGFGNVTDISTNVPDSSVSCLKYDNDLNIVVIAGSFNNFYGTTINSSFTANNVIIWDISNSSWKVLSSTPTTLLTSTWGINTNTTTNGTNNDASVINIYNGNIYVGGRFSTVYNSSTSQIVSYGIALWNITSKAWHPLSLTDSSNVGVLYNGTSTVYSFVYAIEIDKTKNLIYVGGSFNQVCNTTTTRDDMSANNIAVWDIGKKSWGILGSPESNGAGLGGGGLTPSINSVRSITLDSTNKLLYVGGTFSYVNSSQTNQQNNTFTANNIAIWDISNSKWLPIGTTTLNGTNAIVATTLLDTRYKYNKLYVGGDFAKVNSNTQTDLSANGGAIWNT